MVKLSSILTPAFVLALALSAAAQEKPVTTTKEMTDTVKVTVTGQVVLDYVWRSNGLAAYTDSFSAAGATGAGADSENTFEGFLAIRLNVDLSDKVSAVIEIGTERVDGGSINEWGNSGAEDIVLREAHVIIREFLIPEVTFGAGIAPWTFDIRGKGHSFAFDPRHSQSLSRNRSNVADGAGTLNARGGSPEELDPVGFWGRYQRDAIALDLVFLPAVIEGGNPSEDEALYALDFWYNLDNKGSRIGAIFAVSAMGDAGAISGTESGMFTLGGGFTHKGLVDGLELYAEVYFQFGDVGRNATDTFDAGGLAFQLGAEYAFQADMKPWVGLNITMISGDDDTSATDDENQSFLSYENISDLAILEDMYFGYDWDTNYFAIKISGGLSLSVGSGKDNLDLSAIIGFARASEDVEFGGAVGGEDALGNEIDFRAKWHVTKQASLNATLGFLTGSDILEESMGGSSADDSEDSAILFTFGADLGF